MVAISATPLETQGRTVIPVMFANHGRTLVLTAAPQNVPLDGSVRVTLEGEQLDGVLVFATGRAGRTPAEMVNAPPVTVTVGQ